MAIKDYLAKFRKKATDDPREAIRAVLMAEEHADDFVKQFGGNRKLVREYIDVFRKSVAERT